MLLLIIKIHMSAFRLYSFLPYYYNIQGKSKDGFMYVLYINDGHPPWNLVYPFQRLKLK